MKNQIFAHFMTLLGVAWLALLASVVPTDIPALDGIFLALPGLGALACGLLNILED